MLSHRIRLSSLRRMKDEEQINNNLLLDVIIDKLNNERME